MSRPSNSAMRATLHAATAVHATAPHATAAHATAPHVPEAAGASRRAPLRPAARAITITGAALLAAGFSTATAQDAEATIGLTVALDTLWVLVAGVLVFFMQAGFALVETGFHAAKNVVNILMKNSADIMIAAVAFWAVGFALMFGDGNAFTGLSGFFLAGADASPATGDAYQGVFASLDWTGIPLYAKFFFQMVFAGTAATIVSGAIGGRARFGVYLAFAAVLTAFLYPVLGHWVWGGGWLARLGFVDFAGSTVVHAVGGFAALGAVLVLGPRIGRYVGGKPVAMPGHNMTFAALGVFILWLGWYGFNAGSTMGIASDPGLVAHIVLTTTMAAAAGGATALLLSWVRHHKPDFSLTVNGVLGGLVAITAPTAFVGPLAALGIGMIGGAIVVGAIVLLDRLRIDDPVGAIAVHGLAGVWGTIAVGLFGRPELGIDGLLATGSTAQLGVQLFGTLVVSGVAFAASYGAWRLLDAIVGVRVAPRDELVGLDVSEHGTEAYVPADTLRDPIFVGAGD